MTRPRDRTENEQEERCGVCDLPIKPGEGRYRFVKGVVHSHCAERADTSS